MLNDIFDRLEAQENSFRGSLILAPVLAGRSVSVQIAGVTCSLKVEAKGSFTRGFGVLEALSPESARWMRPATRLEREKYLGLLPRLRFIALEQARGGWVVAPSTEGNARFRLSGPAFLREVEAGVQPFDSLLARFDGTHFWFERTDSSRSPAIAAYLRESLAQEVASEKLQKKGLTNFERSAYALVLYGPPPEEEFEPILPVTPTVIDETAEFNEFTDWRSNSIQARLSRSVSHAGARLISYIDRGGVYSVTYQFGERTHTSTVRASDLQVQTSGICLSGQDGDFDLASLVGVMQEASRVQPWQFGDDDY